MDKLPEPVVQGVDRYAISGDDLRRMVEHAQRAIAEKDAEIERLRTEVKAAYRRGIDDAAKAAAEKAQYYDDAVKFSLPVEPSGIISKDRAALCRSVAEAIRALDGEKADG